MWWHWLLLSVMGLCAFFGGAGIAVVAFKMGVAAARGESLSVIPGKGRAHMRTEAQDAEAWDKATGDRAHQAKVAKFMAEYEAIT